MIKRKKRKKKKEIFLRFIPAICMNKRSNKKDLIVRKKTRKNCNHIVVLISVRVERVMIVKNVNFN
jgi:hypothetical protein